MNFNGLVSNTVGLVHLITAILAIVLGTMMLLSVKGSKVHKRVGYGYVTVMLIVNITALMIYELYNKWGIFHWSSLISLLTLIAGFMPMVFKKKNYITQHYSFMYWSVIGLYAAFIGEALVRFPKIVVDEKGEPVAIFYQFIGAGIALTYFIAVIWFIKMRHRWSQLT